MRLTLRLHSGSLARCQAETGPRQFTKWMRYFEREDAREIEKTEKWEHYLAQISALLYRLCGAKDVTNEQMLIKFKAEGASTVKPKEEVVTKEQRIKEAHAFWGAFMAAHGADKKTLKRSRG